MKVCFDTSVVIDIMGKTAWFKDSFAAYDVAMLRKFELLLSVSSTTDIVYVLHSRGLLSKKQARAALETIFRLFDLMDNEPSDCRFAYESDMGDYEDALIAYAAKRNDVDLIVTRNKGDFAHSPVPAVTPEEFLAVYCPDGVEYELVDF